MPEPALSVPAPEIEALFDALPDVVFFVKDQAGRYTHANLTLVSRLGLRRRGELIGRTAVEMFPAGLGGVYSAQDQRVLAGELIEDQLEVHIFPNRRPGWCLTCKRPVRSENRISGVVGISRDLGPPDGRHPTYDRLRRVWTHLQQHYASNVRMQTLADLAGLSVAQLERHFRRVFLLTPRQALNKQRIDAAMRLLQGGGSIAQISAACGFSDQSAFTRRFRLMVGMAPRVYRDAVAHVSVPQANPHHLSGSPR
ncbi:MAG TPA: AraC family transcriptional regulator [Steroidobacteraceae bacterium]|nr:AraC family transcriptional regulator [Steroidobacteraceae bacterium]